MSAEKNRLEARRWLETAEGDLEAARILAERGMFAHTCFHAQQAGEKAVKAVWYLADADPWGHSIKKLIEDLAAVAPAFHARLALLIREGTVLDRFYIPTRYPNGLPDITPQEAFLSEDAASAVELARKLIAAVRPLLA